MHIAVKLHRQNHRLNNNKLLLSLWTKPKRKVSTALTASTSCEQVLDNDCEVG